MNHDLSALNLDSELLDMVHDNLSRKLPLLAAVLMPETYYVESIGFPKYKAINVFHLWKIDQSAMFKQNVSFVNASDRGYSSFLK